MKTVDRAIDLCNQNLEQGKISDDLALALIERGNIRRRTKSVALALDDYSKAIAIAENSLFKKPESQTALMINGTALLERATLQAEISNNELALKDNFKASLVFNDLMKVSRTDTLPYFQKALALCNIGLIQEELSQWDKALDSYKESTATCGLALKKSPESVQVRRFRQIVQKRLESVSRLANY